MSDAVFLLLVCERGTILYGMYLIYFFYQKWYYKRVLWFNTPEPSGRQQAFSSNPDFLFLAKDIQDPKTVLRKNWEYKTHEI